MKKNNPDKRKRWRTNTWSEFSWTKLQKGHIRLKHTKLN